MPLTAEQRDWLALSLVPGVGTTLFVRLLARFATPARVLAASEHELLEVVGPKLAQRIRAYRETVDVQAQERALEQYNAQLVTMDDPSYPAHLAEIYDPPLALFVRGAIHESDEHAVAIVGTRTPSTYGYKMAERLGEQLAARGITVVSGMANGIDTAAHEGALRSGGRTIAVLGCGVDIVYPAENAALMHRIAQQGAVVSTFPMGVKPSKGHFPYRNRVISGMSLGVIVVEAPPGSGSLITARIASEQGREIFAVPGHAGDRNALGPHSLLREGAKLVESIDDIIMELELPTRLKVSAVAQDFERNELSSTPRARAARYSDDQIITVLVEHNPKQYGSASRERFDRYGGYGNQLTVGQALRAGIRREDLTWDVERNFIRVDPAGSAEIVRSIPHAPSPVSAPPSLPSPSRTPAAATAPKPVLSNIEEDVLSALAPEGSFVDEISLACRISVSEALSTLTMLELKGIARQLSGKRFAPR